MNFPVSLLSLHSLHPAATSKFSPLLVLSGLSFTKLRTLCTPSSSALSTNEADLELYQVYCQQQLSGGKESFLEVEADWEMFIPLNLPTGRHFTLYIFNVNLDA